MIRLLTFLLALALTVPLHAGPAPGADSAPAPNPAVAPNPAPAPNPAAAPGSPPAIPARRTAQRPAPPKASEADVMRTIETFLLSTLPDPASYEPLDWSGLVLFEEDESKAYRWGMRHTYRVSHPHYGVLYVDRIFFIAYDGQVESVIEYTGQPCIDCKW